MEACKRCGERNCFGGCIPFATVIDDGPAFGAVRVLMNADMNNIRVVDAKAEFESWFNKEFGVFPNLEGINTHVHMYKAWMAARGWKV